MSEEQRLYTYYEPSVRSCAAVVGHDWRRYDYRQNNKPWTSWRCVWCFAVACGDYTQPDPCMEPYHHTYPHRARSGATWPIGGSRNE